MINNEDMVAYLSFNDGADYFGESWIDDSYYDSNTYQYSSRPNNRLLAIQIAVGDNQWGALYEGALNE